MYWETTVYHNGLNAHDSEVWQAIKGVKASVVENISSIPGHMTASIGVRANVGGYDKEIVELDASGNPLFQTINRLWKGEWSRLTTKLTIPSNADIYQVWIKLRGDWQNCNVYEGSIMIDQVEPVK